MESLYGSNESSQVYLHSWVLLSASPQAYSLKGYLLSNTVVRCFAANVSVPVCQLSLHDASLWVPVKLSAAREGERFERVIAFNANFHFNHTICDNG